MLARAGLLLQLLQGMALPAMAWVEFLGGRLTLRLAPALATTLFSPEP